MDIFITIVSGILIISGIVGCIVPLIPGPPLSYSGFLLFQLSSYGDNSALTIILLGLGTLFITFADFFSPAIGAKFGGSSKLGKIGSVVGLIIGLFLLNPITALLLGPYIGALVGELISGTDFKPALKSAFAALIGTITGILVKLLLSITILVFFIIELISLL